MKLEISFKIIQPKDQKHKKRDKQKRQTDIYTQKHIHMYGERVVFAPGTQGYLRKKTKRESLFEILRAESAQSQGENRHL